MPTRRHLLQLCAMAACGLAVPVFPKSKRPIEFGLFFDPEAVDTVRKRYATLPAFQTLRNRLHTLDRRAERRFMTEEVRFNDHLYHIRRLSDTAADMGFLFLMTGDADAADLAADAVRTIMKFDRWDYFLDGDTPIGFQRASRATSAVSLCVDWLGGRISDRERREWIRTMGRRGCEPCFQATYGMRFPDRVEGWRIDPASTYFEHRPGDRGWDLSNWPRIFDTNNLKAEPAAALAIGAIAYEQEFGADASTGRWIEQAIYSIDGYRTIFEQDGSYNEGISYAGATATHLMQAYSVLKRFRNIDLADQLNWPGFMDYAFALSMPTYDDPAAVVNFGDVGYGLPSAVPYWIAGHIKDPTALWFAENRSPSHNFWSVLWRPDQMESRPPMNRPSLWRSDLEWIVSRSGHDADDLVVALRSGPPYNHEHADRNSLIVKCYGEQLVVDPHRPAYSRTDPTWLMRGTIGHSAVLIDGQGHQYVDGSEGTNASEAVARLIRFGDREGYHFWTSDATQAYQLVMPDVTSVMRTVIVLYDWPAVILVDKVVKHEHPSAIQARFFAYNSDERGAIEAPGAGLVISRPHARLQVTSYSPGGVQSNASLLPLPENIAWKYPYGRVSTAEPSLDTLLISALLPQRQEDRVNAEIAPAGPERYQITLEKETDSRQIVIVDSGRVPEFLVLD